MLELLYLAVGATFIAFLIFNIGVREIGASKASAYINLMPVSAVLIAVLFYGEPVTLVHGVGMLCVMSGVVDDPRYCNRRQIRCNKWMTRNF
jgi:drug/metabolite transporter (DMT)-like permease